jgi:hypothetical protein
MKTKATDFLQGRTPDAIDIVNNTVFSIVLGNSTYALDTDTSDISYGTKLTRVEDVTINGDILTADGITLDLGNTFMAGRDKGIFFGGSEE